jgi:hypothetical protein
LLYRAPLRLPTTTLTGVAVALLIPAPVGTALAVITTAPRIDGFQLQVAMMLGDEPEVNLFLHPEIMIFLALKVTFDATETFAVITIEDRKVAVVAEPARASELKDEVSTTSVTVIVIDCVPALAAASVAVRVIS